MSAGPRIPTESSNKMSDKKIKLSSLRNDIKQEREGAWAPSRAFEGGEYLLKSTNSPDYVAAQQTALREYQERARNNTKPDIDADHRTEAEMVCKHLLMGWRGFDVEYTPEIALSELKDPAQRALLNDILNTASSVGRFKIEFVKDDVKN